MHLVSQADNVAQAEVDFVSRKCYDKMDEGCGRAHRHCLLGRPDYS